MKAASLKIIHAVHPDDFKKYNTEKIRENFLLSDLEKDNSIELGYTHYDRIIAGLAKPVTRSLTLPGYDNLKSKYFLERRELGIINVGGEGTVSVDSQNYSVAKEDCVYAGKGSKEISFSSKDSKNPAIFYLLSTPAHQIFPTVFMKSAEATRFELGSSATSNERTLARYIHEGGIQSCQLVMGVTTIKAGSAWNSVPPHTHDRRSELYFYFDLKPEFRVFHFMGEPQETRHIVMKNLEVVASPSWSVHFGCGTSNYTFIWGMGGENKEFDDMDAAPVTELL